MKIKEILGLPAIEEIVKALKTPMTSTAEMDENLKQYRVKEHTVYDHTKRKKKEIENDGGIKDYVDVARLGIPMQKLIVKRASAFLIGEGIKLVCQTDDDTEKAVYGIIQRIWHDTKLDYRTRELARILFSETEAAELWYLVDNERMWKKMSRELTEANITEGLPKLTLKMKVLSYSKGDRLYPHFDEKGDMDAFSRGYYMNMDGKQIEHLDVYTDTFRFTYRNSSNGWEFVEKLAHNMGKIPVIYYKQPSAEWKDVQDLIERLEELLSNFADTNDYHGSPIMLAKGSIKGMAKKGERGKILEMEEDADIKYLTWEHAPEAIKLEIETLTELIYVMTQTPDISFNRLQGVGNMARASLDLMFLDAKLKALGHQEVFGEGLQRRVNLIANIVGKLIEPLAESALMVDIYPEFAFYMPENEKELIETLQTAVGGGKMLMSREGAIRQNPFVDDPEKEVERIDIEEETDLRRQDFV